jgi:serine/threonine protein phosphatase PrpC
MVHTNLTDFTHGWGKQQDFCLSGSLYDEYGAFKYMIVADGHGTGDIISVLKNDDFPWRDILIQTSSTMISKTIINYLIYFGVLNRSTYDGTTISVAKIYSKFIHLVWLGDSKIQVFIDDKSEFLTPPHNCSNENEVGNFNTSGCYLKDARDFKQTDTKKLVKVKTKRVVIDNNENTALTRCLGHNRVLNEEFQEQFINFTQNNKVDVVAASDGF